jgi:hypothetical protein
MKLVRITEPQASFLEVEIVGRYLEDEGEEAEVAAIVADHLERSRGVSMAVPSLLPRMLLDVINAMDDEIERAKKGDATALRRIGVDTLKQARGLWRSGHTLWLKALAALGGVP